MKAGITEDANNLGRASAVVGNRKDVGDASGETLELLNDAVEGSPAWEDKQGGRGRARAGDGGGGGAAEVVRVLGAEGRHGGMRSERELGESGSDNTDKNRRGRGTQPIVRHIPASFLPYLLFFPFRKAISQTIFFFFKSQN